MTLIEIVVAAHKAYDFSDDAAYAPIQVGRELSKHQLPFGGDDSGDSISGRNYTYCELTGLYWAWRNRDADIAGIVHYRRYFAGSGWRGTATGAEMLEWLHSADLVIPAPRLLFIETVWTHYARAHREQDLEIARDVIDELFPEYIQAFDKVMSQRHLSLYNMFVATRETYERYCAWLFPILDECFHRIPIDEYGPTQRRVIGFLGERLLNVWAFHHSSELRIVHRRVVSLEKESKFTKAVGVLKRRYGYGRRP